MKRRNVFEGTTRSDAERRLKAIVVRVTGDLPTLSDGSSDGDDAFAWVVSALNHFDIPATVNEVSSADPLKELAGAQQAAVFFRELMDSFETLDGVAVEYGESVVPQLLYLQNAILTDSRIDLWQDVDEGVRKAIGRLPSAEKWLAYCVEQGAPSPQAEGANVAWGGIEWALDEHDLSR